jgi:hypothetical protein
MSLGETLRRAREQKKESPSEVAMATRMKVQIVEDLERNDFSRIAAAVYGKGFIKLYAEHMGLNPEPLLQEFADSFAVGKRPSLISEQPPRSPAVSADEPPPTPSPGTAVAEPEKPKGAKARKQREPIRPEEDLFLRAGVEVAADEPERLPPVDDAPPARPAPIPVVEPAAVETLVAAPPPDPVAGPPVTRIEPPPKVEPPPKIEPPRVELPPRAEPPASESPAAAFAPGERFAPPRAAPPKVEPARMGADAATRRGAAATTPSMGWIYGGAAALAVFLVILLAVKSCRHAAAARPPNDDVGQALKLADDPRGPYLK